jgi:SAM-dependent methyltransferase
VRGAALRALRHIAARRAALAREFDVGRHMERIEESCVPSYVHPNLLAAGAAWSRPYAAAALYREFAPPGPVLDFGAATGEVAELLEAAVPYEFVETDDLVARSLRRRRPLAVRRGLAELEPRRYAAIFALDSLEHNDDYAELLGRLAAALAPGGVVILSGPTENGLYRLGRRIVGFTGHYHKTTIADIERAAAGLLSLCKRRIEPWNLPLFAVSCWRR